MKSQSPGCVSGWLAVAFYTLTDFSLIRPNSGGTGTPLDLEGKLTPGEGKPHTPTH